MRLKHGRDITKLNNEAEAKRIDASKPPIDTDAIGFDLSPREEE